MIPELGQFVIILAFIVACLQAVLPMIGAARGDSLVSASARPLALAQVVLVGLAFLALTWAHASSDFSVLNVVENSHSAKPFIYKLTGVWGNHEGSMLLWVLILASFGGVLASSDLKDRQLQARTLSIQGAVTAAFLAFVIFTSNPFARLFPTPVDGMDLNPLLQDPGLIIHPPFLYLGYVGFSIVFAFAVAGLISGKVDQDWARVVRPWALAAWVFLTIGIMLGSWWAYYELGWGGFWGWDPVENASFMPWLAGTAFIHSVRVLEKRGTMKVWTILLAIAAFSLSLIGTFLVRSGIITSVHAFAVDPERGIFILAILTVVIGGSLLLFALRAPSLKSSANFTPVSREGAIIVNNILMSAACITVFVGTFYPLFYEIITGGKLSVGAPYFNATFLPLMMLLLLIIAPAAMLSWKRDALLPAFKLLWPAGLVAVFLIVLALYFTWPKPIAASLGVGLAGWTALGVIIDLARRTQLRTSGAQAALKKISSLPRAYLGMSVAHFGVAILALGVIGAGVWRSEEIRFMNPGDQVEVGGYAITLDKVVDREGPNFFAETAYFSIRKEQRPIRQMSAERRFYPVRGMLTTEAGIWTSLKGDLYLTLGANNPETGHVVRAWYNPLAVWLWIGGGLIAVGGIVAAVPRKKKALVKAPTVNPNAEAI